MADPITIGELTDVPAPNSPINAQFHQEVANRIAHRFGSVALMNGWAASNGSLAYAIDTGLIYWRTGGAWVPIAANTDMIAAPLGILARAVVTATQDISTTMVDLTGASVAFTAVAGRWYRVWGWFGGIFTSLGTINQVLAIRTAANVVQNKSVEYAAVNQTRAHYVEQVYPGTLSGAQTFKLSAQAIVNPGPDASMRTDISQNGGHICVEDCGAV